MATYSKQLLSGSSQGQPITVVATASQGTLIHNTQTSSTAIDEIWLYATNTSGGAVNLTVQYGGTGAVQNAITLSIPSQSGLTLVVPGLVLTGTGSAATPVYAFAGTTNVITISGYVNRVQ
jgi:hypothetical protein